MSFKSYEFITKSKTTYEARETLSAALTIGTMAIDMVEELEADNRRLKQGFERVEAENRNNAERITALTVENERLNQDVERYKEEISDLNRVYRLELAMRGATAAENSDEVADA